MALHRRLCFDPEESASVQHFFGSISRRIAKQAHFSIPITVFDSPWVGSKYFEVFVSVRTHGSGPGPNLGPMGTHGDPYGPKQILFVTSAYPSLPLTISDRVAQVFTKRISKIWNSFERLVRASRRSELLLHLDCMNRALGDLPFADQALDLLDMRFKAILSLKKVIVNFQVYSEEDLSDDRIKMRDRGWTVEITKLPKKKWISVDDRVEFDNGEECNAYNEEWHRHEWQREQDQEDRLWEEEYYHRRRDPYWKNDSDYD
ncbi:hypothetical protein LAWI1_G004341 [Lachnellula willkommii]|uniref:Uncharacterized protein n=1 Tax=Lachnellula willkommii TaxID=215461 RepID=A0A559MDS4_9HELO|nr:hypothetical protein LAWI1_G004341 [Lachnellula willkommii]